MSQPFFDDLFADQTFGPRDGFTPRPWQVECTEFYWNSVEAWQDPLSRNGSGGQHCFCVYAAVASGKTKASALMACYLLNAKLIDTIVVVVPNRSISRKTREDYRTLFGMDLVRFHAGKYKDGVPRLKQGYILTYAHLMQNPELHAHICGPGTLVIFDEVHHLGDSSGWGKAAKDAFHKVNYVVCLTGTPYRSDNRLIPFVTYESTETEGLHRFRADFTYSLGEAILDSVCREPVFVWCDGTVEIGPQGFAGVISVTFKDKDVTAAVASLRLSGAVRYGSKCRRDMLRNALERCREEKRKVIIFLGGDTEGAQTPTEDATQTLPLELEELGITPDEFEVVTGEDIEAQTKIEKFGRSKKWILVSINMVSEGTDIAELSAAIFLTSITAKQTTIQRIGRVLRWLLELHANAPKNHPDALVFMLEDPEHKDVAAKIKKEIEIETQLRKARKEREEKDPDGGSEGARKAEAIGVDGGNFVAVTISGHDWDFEIVSKAERIRIEAGLPHSMLETLLSLIVEEQSRVQG